MNVNFPYGNRDLYIFFCPDAAFFTLFKPTLRECMQWHFQIYLNFTAWRAQSRPFLAEITSFGAHKVELIEMT